jgi:hypothetical protein
MLAPINRAQTTTCISLRDDAIDWDHIKKRPHPKTKEEQPAYMFERHIRPSSWRELVPMLPGKTPCVFEIGVVPPDEMNRLDDECNTFTEHERTKEMSWRAFIHGLRGINGWHDAREKIATVQVDGLDYVDPDWIRERFVGPLRHVATEVGQVIWLWNQLSARDTGN